MNILNSCSNFFKNIILKTTNRLGYRIINEHFFVNTFIERSFITQYIKLHDKLDKSQQNTLLEYSTYSRSQSLQDLFVLSQVAINDIPKFFVEFGATDGITLSNTYLLETQLGWEGIVAEPARIWHKSLARNRHCNIDFRCVTDQSGKQIEFLEVQESNNSIPELSSIAQYSSGDWASNIRAEKSKKYLVPTISLNDLLQEYNAPSDIGYLSIDTEGSEFMILNSLDFSKYKIRIITVEHNFQEVQRDKIFQLLSDHGFQRVFEDLSRWDDWYILA